MASEDKLGAPAALVSVVLVNWRNGRDTIECIGALLGSDYGRFSVVVVDNDSRDGSLESISEWLASRGERAPQGEGAGEGRDEHKFVVRPQNTSVVLISAHRNDGFAAGCNIGIRYSLAREAKYVWLLNNDAAPKPSALSAMVVRMERGGPRCGVAGSTIRYFAPPHAIQVVGGGRIITMLGTLSYPSTGEQSLPSREPAIDYVMGASMLIRTEVFREIGLIDERYFLGWEETDFCRRASLNGWRLCCAIDSEVLHKDSATVGRGSRLSDYYGVRNSIWFLRRYFPLSVIPATLVGGTGRLMKRIIAGQWSRLPIVLMGYWDGLFNIDRKFGRV